MEPLNYCRQLARFLSAGTVFNDSENRAEKCRSLARKAQKFLLPDGGRLCEDKEYKALNEKERLCLPYPIIALEYKPVLHLEQAGKFMPTKTIVFAHEYNERIIEINIVCWCTERQTWALLPAAAIRRVDYLRRDIPLKDGYVCIEFQRSDDRLPFSDYADEIGALLNFLNILQCSNVTTETIAPRKQAKKARRGDALPFDTYHILKVNTHSERNGTAHPGGTHRSPREHLRRGHIRRLPDGRRIWVNASVICAGVGGRVQKDYALVA